MLLRQEASVAPDRSKLAVAATAQRFNALDGLRGLCALCVCLFHFRAAGPISTAAFVQGSWLFVDFFFVLSGFVIAFAWSDRLNSPRQAGRFALLRFGRVYPLHIAVLAAFLVTELIGAWLAPLGLMQRAAFAEMFSPTALLLSLGFGQIFGLQQGLSGWNGPAWSIAAEFWTYLLFAGVLLIYRRHAGWPLLALAVTSAVVLAVVSPAAINATWEFGMWRCLYGFAVGALVWRWTVAGRTLRGGTLPELAALAAVALFVGTAQDSRVNLLAPLLFGVAIHIFAAERGALSHALKMPWAQRLGLWSFSIYMVHAFVQARFDDLLRIVARVGGPQLLAPVTLPDGRVLEEVGTSATQGVLLTLLMLALVLIIAAITHRYIELPGQRLTRWLADRLETAKPIVSTDENPQAVNG